MPIKIYSPVVNVAMNLYNIIFCSLPLTHSVPESVGQVKLAFDLPSLSVERNQLWLQLFEESIRQQLLQVSTLRDREGRGQRAGGPPACTHAVLEM